MRSCFLFDLCRRHRLPPRAPHSKRLLSSPISPPPALLSSPPPSPFFGSLQGKSVGLLFSSAMAPMLCDWFIPLLAQAFKEISIWNADFEIVMVPCEMGEEYFTAYFSGEMSMPWRAVPFGNVSLPSPVVLDANGKVVTTKGVELANRYRGAAYPLTEERVRELEEEAAAMLQNPTIENMLISSPMDFVLSGDGNTVLLRVSMREIRSCGGFDRDGVATFRFITNIKLLINLYDYKLVIIRPDGKLLCRGVSNVVKNHGIDAYPFTAEKLEEVVAQHDRAKIESQTLELLLVSGELDYVIGKDDLKVPVSELVGINILFYLSKKNGAFTELLHVFIKAYCNIKERGNSFETKRHEAVECCYKKK